MEASGLLRLRGGQRLPALELRLLLAELGLPERLLELRRLRHAVGLKLRQVLRPGQLSEALRRLKRGEAILRLRLRGLLEELGIELGQSTGLLAS